MTNPVKPSSYSEPPTQGIPSRMRIRIGLLVTLFGLLLFLIGARPALFDLDRSPVVGFVQIAVFLVGLAIICIGGYIGLMSFWNNGSRTIAAELGSRLVATGFVVAVFSGMADVFGFSSQTPNKAFYFGPVQATGVEIGEALIAIGFLLLIPYHLGKKKAAK